MLTTRAAVKQYVGINTDADDALLDRMIAAATEYIENWLSRSMANEARTTVVDGNGLDVLYMPHYPITAVASVSVDGRTIALAPSSLDSGYRFDANRIVLVGGTFTRGRMNVEVQYTAGPLAVPADVEQACIEMVGLRYKQKGNIGVTSKGLAGESISFDQKDMPASSRNILNRYRRVIPA